MTDPQIDIDDVRDPSTLAGEMRGQVLDRLAALIASLDDPGCIERIERALPELVDDVVSGRRDNVPPVRDGEPIFLLCGRDAVGAPLIEAWAYLRSGHVIMAQRSLEQVMSVAAHLEPQSGSDPQIRSAFNVARDFRSYQQEIALGVDRGRTASAAAS